MTDKIVSFDVVEASGLRRREVRVLLDAVATRFGSNAAEQLRTAALQDAANEQARRYLADTDWYAIRAAETGQPVPADVAAARAAARATVRPANWVIDLRPAAPLED